MQVANALMKKAGVALVRGNGELAVEACDLALARYGGSDDSMVRRQVAEALEMKGRAQNRMGLPDEALATYRTLVGRFGAVEGDGGVPMSWLAMGIEITAKVLQGDEDSALRAFRTLCNEMEGENPVVLHRLVWDTINLVAGGASPGPLADVLAQHAKKSEALAPLLAALQKLSGHSIRVPEEVAQVADDVIEQIRMRSQGRLAPGSQG